MVATFVGDRSPRQWFRNNVPKNMKRALVVAAALGLAACAVPSSPNIGCTAVFVPGVSVTITDSVTGTIAGMTNVWATAREGTYSDSSAALMLPAQLIVNLAGERVGTYVVSVGATGYKTQSTSGVSVVRLDVCHVKTVLINAKLVRTP